MTEYETKEFDREDKPRYLVVYARSLEDLQSRVCAFVDGRQRCYGHRTIGTWIPTGGVVAFTDAAQPNVPQVCQAIYLSHTGEDEDQP